MIENEILEKVKSRIFEKQEPVLKTGFNDLDNILMELEKSSIITVGGRPSMGKTSFLINIMLNLLEQKKKCLYLSNEDSYAYYVLRKFIPILTNIEVVRIKYQMEEINKQERDEIIRALAKIGQLDLTILGTDEGSFDIEKTNKKMTVNDAFSLVDNEIISKVDEIKYKYGKGFSV